MPRPKVQTNTPVCEKEGGIQGYTKTEITANRPDLIIKNKERKHAQ